MDIINTKMQTQATSLGALEGLGDGLGDLHPDRKPQKSAESEFDMEMNQLGATFQQMTPVQNSQKEMKLEVPEQRTLPLQLGPKGSQNTAVASTGLKPVSNSTEGFEIQAPFDLSQSPRMGQVLTSKTRGHAILREEKKPEGQKMGVSDHSLTLPTSLVSPSQIQLGSSEIREAQSKTGFSQSTLQPTFQANPELGGEFVSTKILSNEKTLSPGQMPEQMDWNNLRSVADFEAPQVQVWSSLPQMRMGQNHQASGNGLVQDLKSSQEQKAASFGINPEIGFVQNLAVDQAPKVVVGPGRKIVPSPEFNQSGIPIGDPMVSSTLEMRQNPRLELGEKANTMPNLMPKSNLAPLAPGQRLNSQGPGQDNGLAFPNQGLVNPTPIKKLGLSQTLGFHEKIGQGPVKSLGQKKELNLNPDLNSDFSSTLPMAQNLSFDPYHRGLEPSQAPVKSEVSANVVPGAMAQSRISTDGLATIGNGIHHFSMQGGGEFRIRLKPDHLGELSVRVMTEGNRVGLKIQASDERAKKLLEDSLGYLKEGLSAQNLSLGQVDLTLAKSDAGADARQFQSHSGFQEGITQDQNQGQRQREFREGSQPEGGNEIRKPHVLSRSFVPESRSSAGSSRLDLTA